MIDCHNHLADKNFDHDRDEVIERAKKAGVVACLVNTEGVAEFDTVLRLHKLYGALASPCFGVHPVQYVKQGEDIVGRSATLDDCKELDGYVERHCDSLIALGECGLDYSPRFVKNGEADKSSQREVLKRHVELGLRFDLPLFVIRSAGRPTIEAALEYGAMRVLMHAFDGNAKSARPGIDKGYYFSIPPSSIHSDQKKALIKAVPMEQLLLETDAPVLGPDREARNEPCNIHHSAELVASIKQMSVEEVIEKTMMNALRLFPKLVHFVKL